MKQLIVTADDFGMNHEVNEAIERDHQAGLLTQASLMVNEPGADEAVRIARRNPNLCIGLHLTLCLGSATRISGLTDASKNLEPSPMRAGLRYFFNARLRDELAHEISAQFARFLEFGFAPCHWDGHTHLHLHPTIFDLTVPVAHGLGFRAVRLVRERGSRPIPLVFQWLSRRAIPPLRARGIRFTDRIFGLHRTGRMDTRFIGKMIRALPEGVSEIYCHPGSERSPFDAARLVDVVAQSNVVLTNWRELG